MPGTPTRAAPSTTDTLSIEDMVAAAFPDAPYMVAIARCESHLRQYSAPGVVLMGGGGGNYIGIFQIGRQWVPTAREMGLDVYTPEGNIAFARYLFDEYGASSQWECFNMI